MSSGQDGMDPVLLARARGLLAQASVIAEASSSRLNTDKAKSQPHSTIPRIGGIATFDFFAQRLAGCRSDHALREVVSALESELEAIRKRPKVPEVKFKQRVVWEWQGTDYKTVAKLMKASERSVRRWREEAGLDPNTGERKAA